MWASSSPVSTWANLALPPEVAEYLAVHERRPTLTGAVRMHAVVVDVAVVLLGHKPERHETEDRAGVVEHPQPVGIAVVRP
jgi:hypothetical protein